MLKKIQRVFCAFLCALVLVSVCNIAPTAEAISTTNTPVIYITGRKTEVVSKTGKTLYPMSTSISSVIDKNMDKIVKAAAKGVTLNNWTELSDLLYELINPLFKEFKLNKDGEISNGSHSLPTPEPVKNTKGNYGLFDYKLEYDNRLDPWDVAAQLRTHVKKVLKATGKKKVSIISRCMGSDILACYLVRYKSDPLVDTAIFYAAANNGVLITSAPFSGQIYLNQEKLKAAAQKGSANDDEEFTGLLTSFYKIFGKLGVGFANNELKQALPEILPRLLRITYGNMPSYWAMVGSEYYESALKFVFGGNPRKGAYKKLVEKADRYQKKVKPQLNKTLKDLASKGMKVNIITKYNIDFDPIYEGDTQNGDGWIEAKNMSFGATFADKGKTLSSSRINSLSKSGLGNYVSADKVIDATTALFPDSTWFIKNFPHASWPSCVNDLMCRMINSTKQFTVKSSKDYPQFLNLSGSQLTKMASYATRYDPIVSSVKLSATTYAYDGNVKTPSVTVKDVAGKTLKKGTDYTVSYSSGRKAMGTYYATVKFIGKYKSNGSKKLSFKILPANVKVTSSVSGTTVTLSWAKVKGASKYRVYKYDSTTKAYKRVADIKTNKYKASKLSTGCAYMFTVRAITTSGKNTFMSPKYTDSICVIKPVAPTITVKRTASKQAVISWKAVRGGTNYEVYRSTSKDGKYNLIATVTGTSYTDKTLLSFRKYYYKVRAVKVFRNKNYNGSCSSVKGTA